MLVTGLVSRYPDLSENCKEGLDDRVVQKCAVHLECRCMHNNYIHGKNFHFSICTTVLLRVSHFSDIKIQPEDVLAGLHLEIDQRRGAKYVFVKQRGGGQVLCTFAQAHVH